MKNTSNITETRNITSAATSHFAINLKKYKRYLRIVHCDIITISTLYGRISQP